MMRKILVVFNPVAGRGKAAKLCPKVIDFLEQQNIHYTLSPTDGSSNAMRVVKTALDASYTDVLAIGGDGTLNEVVDGMAGHEIPLGIIPAGTGNDYVKMLDLGKNLADQLQTALYGPIHAVDLGQCNERRFINGMGIGFDGQITQNMIQSKTWLTGHAKYYFHVLKILAFFKSIRLDLKIDGKEATKDYLLLAIAKGTTFGGGFKLTPHGSLTNGQFALCEIAPMTPLRRFLNILRLEKGTHEVLPEVTFGSAKELTIGTSVEAKAHIDGEFIGSPPFHIKVLPKALLVRTRAI